MNPPTQTLQKLQLKTRLANDPVEVEPTQTVAKRARTAAKPQARAKRVSEPSAFEKPDPVVDADREIDFEPEIIKETQVKPKPKRAVKVNS